MSAPFFCSTALLTADLALLDYPHRDEPDLLHPDSDARLALLHWLALVIDPTLSFPSVDHLARFFHTLGLHSAPPAPPHGLPVPFLAPNRPKERAAAFVFLRAALDLALAVRRLRPDDNLPHWAHSPSHSSTPNDLDSDDDDAPLLNDLDVTSMKQLDLLINHRHTLFPSTNSLFTSIKPPPKRPPLTRREPSSPNVSATSARARQPHIKTTTKRVVTPSSNKPVSQQKPPLRPQAKTFISRRAHYPTNSPPPRATPRSPSLVSSITRSSSMSHIESPPPLSLSLSRSSPHARSPRRSPPRSPTLPNLKQHSPNVAKSRPKPNVVSLPSRESLMDRLRNLRRQTADSVAVAKKKANLESSVAALVEDGDEDEYEDKDKEEENCVDVEMVDKLATTMESVHKLAKEAEQLAKEGEQRRVTEGRVNVLDREMQEVLTETVPQCRREVDALCDMLSGVATARLAVEDLRCHERTARSFPTCPAVRVVERERRRAERHL